jgi:hypothetical protein
MLNELFKLIGNGHVLDLIEEWQTPWQTLDVLYEQPRVERVWLPLDTEQGARRLFIHRIHPCDKAFFHPHPWPSAVVLLSAGFYKMNFGVGPASGPPPEVVMSVYLTERSGYEMSHPLGWHDVQPIGKPSISIMLTGAPWSDAPALPAEQKAKNPPLSEEAKNSVLAEARGLLLPDF